MTCWAVMFCFRGRRGDLIKLIWHDGQVACLFAKKVERGRFIWPNVEGGAVSITPAQLSYLLSGFDWRAPKTSGVRHGLEQIVMNLFRNMEILLERQRRDDFHRR